MEIVLQVQNLTHIIYAQPTDNLTESIGIKRFSFPLHRYAGQTSNPIYLQKGKFYYMESIMKDDHQADHLEVGLKTPDGSFYKVVPSQFLWINLPLPPGRWDFI